MMMVRENSKNNHFIAVLIFITSGKIVVHIYLILVVFFLRKDIA